MSVQLMKVKGIKSCVRSMIFSVLGCNFSDHEVHAGMYPGVYKGGFQIWLYL